MISNIGSTIRDYLREDLKAFSPYNVYEDKCKHKLDSNESPFKMNEEISEPLCNWLKNEQNLNLYPDTDSIELRKKIGQRWGLDYTSVTVGNGSDQLLDYITKAFLEQDDIVIVPSPSFSMYKLCTILNHGKAVEVPLIKSENDFSFDIDEVITKAQKHNAKMIFVCTPNNPTGSVTQIDKVRRLLDSVSCPVIVDEAYDEFNENSSAELISEYDNLIILRTFSKAFGLAGIRLGYALGSKAAIDCIEVAREPYNLNTITQVIGVFALDNNAALNERIEFLKSERERLFKACQKSAGITPFLSGANFIYIEADYDISAVMKENGILIRSFGKAANGRYAVRITIGSKEANDAVIAVAEMGESK